MTRPPSPDEYAAYYSTYVSRVPEGDLLATLEREATATRGLLSAVPRERERFRYAEGKWSIREVLGHIVDTERLFTFRALHFARRDPAPLPGMDQDHWAAVSNAAERPLGELLADFAAVRSATLALFRSFDEEILSRTGEASGNRFSVRAVAWIVAGHEIHHRGILAERYLGRSGS